jgi:hypothetical protein
MTKFKGMKTLDEVCELMKNKGMEVDKSDFEKGGDWVDFKGGWDHLPLTVTYNTCNGRFFVWNGFTGKQMATESSENLENENWYSELLNTFYVAE